MGIRLVPENPFVEEQHYCYAEWDEIHEFIKERCSQLFTEEEITRAYLSDGLEVSEEKAIEISNRFISLGSPTEAGNQFYTFCKDSKGFTIK